MANLKFSELAYLFNITYLHFDYTYQVTYLVWLL